MLEAQASSSKKHLTLVKCGSLNKTWEENEKYATGSKIDFVIMVKENKYKDFLFKKFTNRDLMPFEYLQNQNMKTVEKMVFIS